LHSCTYLLATSDSDTDCVVMYNPQQRQRVSQTTGAAKLELADGIPFPVLCMHDSTSNGASNVDTMLMFKKGEILDVIQCRDDIGWWAAMRTEGSNEVGWISKSYVQRLSKEMAEKLRKIPQIVRVHEYNAEELYNSPVDSGFNLN